MSFKRGGRQLYSRLKGRDCAGYLVMTGEIGAESSICPRGGLPCDGGFHLRGTATLRTDRSPESGACQSQHSAAAEHSHIATVYPTFHSGSTTSRIAESCVTFFTIFLDTSCQPNINSLAHLEVSSFAQRGRDNAG